MGSILHQQSVEGNLNYHVVGVQLDAKVSISPRCFTYFWAAAINVAVQISVVQVFEPLFSQPPTAAAGQGELVLPLMRLKQRRRSEANG